MSKAKHTPGPWVVESNGYYPVVRKHFHLAHHMDVCGPVHGYMYSADQKSEQEANARLIAAAPDLLAMLKVAQLWLDVDGSYDMQGINAAIAKAEGRS